MTLLVTFLPWPLCFQTSLPAAHLGPGDWIHPETARGCPRVAVMAYGIKDPPEPGSFQRPSPLCWGLGGASLAGLDRPPARLLEEEVAVHLGMAS